MIVYDISTEVRQKSCPVCHADNYVNCKDLTDRDDDFHPERVILALISVVTSQQNEIKRLEAWKERVQGVNSW